MNQDFSTTFVSFFLLGGSRLNPFDTPNWQYISIWALPRPLPKACAFASWKILASDDCKIHLFANPARRCLARSYTVLIGMLGPLRH